MSCQRDFNRLPVQWPVVMMVDGVASGIRGRTINLGMGGAGIILDASLPNQGSLTLYLGLPPNSRGLPFTAVEIRCRIAHAEYSNEYESFRAGLQFRSFVGDGEQRLENALAERSGEPLPRRQRAPGELSACA